MDPSRMIVMGWVRPFPWAITKKISFLLLFFFQILLCKRIGSRIEFNLNRGSIANQTRIRFFQVRKTELTRFGLKIADMSVGAKVALTCHNLLMWRTIGATHVNSWRYRLVLQVWTHEHQLRSACGPQFSTF